jgi:DNA/RNA-binding domain of Phe-tRNA-synthetase-like protein
MVPLEVDEHPLLDLGALEATFPRALAELPSPEWLLDLLRPGAGTPLVRGEETKKLVRDLLRHGGYKPAGRGRPASEYLVKAAGAGRLGSINAPVDVCNVVSLHSGLPISVVDLDLTRGTLRAGLAPEGASYVFNAGGQEIRFGGLLCLLDAEGPCANAVKDSQRTKTHAGTTRTLSLVWGTRALAGRTAAAVAYYRELLERLGATVSTR